MLDPVRNHNFIVFHDDYQYFETTFDFRASGAISLADGLDPSPARIAEIQTRAREEGINCVLAEPQFNKWLIATGLEQTQANTVVINPLGAGLEKGPEPYPQFIRNMAKTLVDCLRGVKLRQLAKRQANLHQTSYDKNYISQLTSSN